MKQELAQAVAAVVKDLFDTDVSVDLTRPDEQFGDFATNVAMQLAGKLGKNPREIAETLAAKLRELPDITKAEVAGPGFVNITVDNSSLLQALNQPPAKPLEGKVIVTEYSDMNPFKQSHVGHLYTTIVGDVISRLYKSAGATVHRVNFGGDVGLHVARTMWGIIKHLGGENPEGLSEAGTSPREQTTWLSQRYVEGTKASEEDEAAKQEIVEINQRIYQLHDANDHDSAFAQIYWTCREWSYDYFKEFYDLLQVSQFEKYYPESVTAPEGIKVVREQLANGVYQESDGAVVFDGEKYGLHTRVFINSKGLPTYEAKDVGLSMQKWDDYHFDESVIITGNDIQQYMQVVLKSIEQFKPELANRTKHITHGNVKLAGGVKMSSRLGNGLAPEEVIESARQASQQQTGKMDESVVIGAVKYAFLRSRIGGDLIYDPVESVSIEGNSGPYLQYAHTRARSILAKTEGGAGELTDLQPGERTLVRKLCEYPDVVALATNELMPHHICTYLYELAQTFNRFYEQNRVIGDTRQAQRLTLVAKYAETLKAGLGLLGMSAPEQM
ncbi:arginine--tRNA ligase [Candidatus Saccharibacteria bacterium]|nr:arginine--tRNA ligase [Candidatus Saccharibacteria bacterium]